MNWKLKICHFTFVIEEKPDRPSSSNDKCKMTYLQSFTVESS
jgi:hypothetical protein